MICKYFVLTHTTSMQEVTAGPLWTCICQRFGFGQPHKVSKVMWYCHLALVSNTEENECILASQDPLSSRCQAVQALHFCQSDIHPSSSRIQPCSPNDSDCQPGQKDARQTVLEVSKYLCYPSTSTSSRPPSKLSSYYTRSPPHHFSPYRRGDLSDSTYHPASIIRSPTPLAQPVDWRPVYNHGAATNTTFVPSSSNAEMRVSLIDNASR